MRNDEAIAWLFSLHRFGMKLGLENIRTLTDALGRPQDRFASVLVAGTNGKGSTSAMLHQVLLASGVRSGLYTSPHLIRTEERIRIGDAEIGEDALAEVLTEIRTTIDRLLAARSLGAHPTFFEVITAAALLSFARAKVEVAVLEVGLGGRFDATNVVEPILSIITNVELDHQEHLGSTRAAIAREKAGILRRDVPALFGGGPPFREGTESDTNRGRRSDLEGESAADAMDARSAEHRDHEDEALRVIGDEASRIGAKLVLARDACSVRSLDILPRGLFLAIESPVRSYPRIDAPLPGVHQADNVLLAVRAAEILAETRPSIDARSIAAGIAAARWPGRLEWVPGRPPLLLDGAHNPAGARALADYVATLPGRPVLVFGAMHDKDIRGMLSALLRVVGPVVFTRPAYERAAMPGDLAATAASIDPARAGIVVEPDVATALARGRALAGTNGVVLVAGSLFLVGAAKEALEREAASNEPASSRGSEAQRRSSRARAGGSR